MEAAAKTCLVVDDSDFDRKIVEGCVTKAGLSVITAKSGEEALKLAKQKLPDCFLIDWEMPGMTGIELLKELRAVPGAEEIPIVFCTSHEHPSFVGHAFVQGATGYISKPITVQKVEDTFEGLGLLRDGAA